MTIAGDLSDNFAGVHFTVSFFHETFFHQDNGRPPRMPLHRWSPSGSGGGQHMSLANQCNHSPTTSSGQPGRLFLMSTTDTRSCLNFDGCHLSSRSLVTSAASST